MIWIIGGTSEGRQLVGRISDLDNFLVTVATEDGKDFLDVENLIVARLSYQEMLDFIDEKDIKLIVDLTHPFATIVSANARKAAQERGIEYARYVRKTLDRQEDVIYVDSYQEAYDYLENIEGTVFFTTGSKNIRDFERVRGENRFIYRILPALESIKIANENQVHLRDLVAVLGPFSKDYNKIMLKEYGADYCVSKDSGNKGGTEEKIQACRELGIPMILIGREEEKGYASLDAVEELIRSSDWR